MAIIVIACPHCLTEKVTMQIISSWGASSTDTDGYATCRCQNCNKPVGVAIRATQRTSAEHAKNIGGNIEKSGYLITDIFPNKVEITAPQYCPESVERVFVQAVSAMRRQEFDSAGAMFRKALEIALKAKAPEAKGMLAQRIRTLAANGVLTKDLADWASEIKDLGNPAVHEEEEPSPDDIERLAGLTEMVLRYIYTLPGMVHAKRAERADAI